MPFSRRSGFSASQDRPFLADLSHAKGVRVLDEEHIGEEQQHAVSAPHIAGQCLQHLWQPTLYP